LCLISSLVNDKDTKYKSAWAYVWILTIGFIVIFIGQHLFGIIYIIESAKKDRKTFTIHELTENNKTLLREIGFEEGSFISVDNLDYSGFRYGPGDIVVCYNGRCSFKYGLNNKCQVIVNQIRKMPELIEEYRNKENDEIRYKENLVKIKKSFGIVEDSKNKNKEEK
jgi:hypothetical protein